MYMELINRLREEINILEEKRSKLLRHELRYKHKLDSIKRLEEVESLMGGVDFNASAEKQELFKGLTSFIIRLRENKDKYSQEAERYAKEKETVLDEKLLLMLQFRSNLCDGRIPRMCGCKDRSIRDSYIMDGEWHLIEEFLELVVSPCMEKDTTGLINEKTLWKTLDIYSYSDRLGTERFKSPPIMLNGEIWKDMHPEGTCITFMETRGDWGYLDRHITGIIPYKESERGK